jgi:steroid delta-isomerase-like uncharacterized protein
MLRGRVTPDDPSAARNAALLRSFHRELFKSGDIATVDEFFAADFVSHSIPPGLPTGVEGVRRFFAMFADALADIEVSIDELVAQGDRVAIATTTSGTHEGELMGVPPTGRRVAIAGIDLVRIDGGKIVEHRGLTDMVGLMRQLAGG